MCNQDPGPDPRFENEVFTSRDGGLSPAVDPFCILYSHIDTAMTVWMPIIFMPVSAVNGNPGISDIRIPGYPGQIEYGHIIYSTGHVVGGTFAEWLKPAGG
mgnify:CR=1 FL=1